MVGEGIALRGQGQGGGGNKMVVGERGGAVTGVRRNKDRVSLGGFFGGGG